MQKLFYEDNGYVVLWYSPLFSAWRNDRFTGYQPQPAPNGDPLQGYGGPSKTWLTLHEVSAGSGAQTTKGVPAAVWLLVAGVVLVLGAVLLRRRRRAEEDEA